MRKILPWVTGVIMVCFLGFPFLMAWFMPAMAMVWTDWTTIVVFGILGAVASLYYRLVGDSRPSYEYRPDRGYLIIELDSSTLLIDRGTRTVAISITPDKRLWIRDETLNGSDVITSAEGMGRTIHLEGGDFHVSREKHGYRIVWSEIDKPWVLR
jgi:hypothetical protein